MCQPKPLGRCANHLTQQYERLLTKETQILTVLQDETTTLPETMTLVQELTNLETDKQKNRIDWYITQRKKLQLSPIDSELLEQRFRFQQTAHQKLQEAKTTYADEREGLWASIKTAETIIATTEYDLSTIATKYQNLLIKLENPLLSNTAKQKIKMELQTTYTQMLILEMNLADIQAYLKEHQKAYEKTYTLV